MSSSSLYGYAGNVVVSSNNVTTLYNATPGNVVTANVPDRDFTTLYTKQSDIGPTKNYGNSNVEAFLNSGTDGANTVQNIRMSGNITVGSQSYLGNVGNVHIDGGNSGYVLVTDGLGNLIWSNPSTGQGGAEYIHFDVISTGNNQTFTDSMLDAYTSNTAFNVMKNGVNIEPQYYVKTGLYTFQVNILLNAGDTIDVLAGASAGGSGGIPAGTVTQVQYNGGYSFAASSNFTFDEANSLLTVSNLDVPSHTTLGSVSNVHISGGSANYVLRTDGAGNLSWIPQSDSNGHPAGSAYQVQFNSGSNTFAASANLTFNTTTNALSATQFIGNGSQLTSITGANVTGTVANATYSDTANYAYFSNVADISNVSYSVSGSNVVGTVGSATTAGTVTGNAQTAITSVGTLTGLTSTGTINFTSASNVSLGGVANIHISGGSANYYLSTDGAGNLSWNAISGGSNATPGGSNTFVQFNDANVFGGNSSFTYNKTTTTLAVPIVQAPALTEIINATEVVVFPGSAVTGTYTYDTSASSVVQCLTNTAGNFVINFTNLTISTAHARSFAFINKNAAGSSYHVTGISIGGAAQTVNWSGGSAPSSGTLNDIYNITIIQTATGVYSVFASVGTY